MDATRSGRAFRGTSASAPNSCSMSEGIRDSLTNSNPRRCAQRRATSSNRQPGCPETAINAMSLAHDIKSGSWRTRADLEVCPTETPPRCNIDRWRFALLDRSPMNKSIGLALFLAMALLFFIANRGANQGFFQGDELDSLSWTPQIPAVQGDELDSLSWTPQIPAADFAKDLVNPVYNARNFRPVGHLYFRIVSGAFGLDFRHYLLPLHLLHLLNVWLLWLVLRNVGASPFAASAGALFFAFHMAVFDVYWKPMYVFDLFCAAFCLLSFLFWIKRRWVLSFLAFWLAYKSKELAVMLPAVLACYEIWFGKRQWRPLIPFFLVSLSFGLQGIFRNPNQDNDYAFRFTPAA